MLHVNQPWVSDDARVEIHKPLNLDKRVGQPLSVNRSYKQGYREKKTFMFSLQLDLLHNHIIHEILPIVNS